MTQEQLTRTHQTSRRRETLRRNARVEKLGEGRKNKGSNSVTALEEENLVFKEQVRELLVMTPSHERGAASSAESSAEWQTLQGQDAMSTTRLEAMTWIEEKARHSSVGSAWGHLTEQAGVVLAEIGGHSGTSMCSTMAEFTNKNMF